MTPDPTESGMNTPAPASPGLRPWRRWASRALMVLVFGFVAWIILRNIREIRQYEYEFRWMQIAGAFLAMCGAYFGMSLVWRDIAGSFGIHASFAESCRIWLLSQLGKYVPGKMGIVLVRLDAYRGHPGRSVAVATSVEYMAVLTANLTLVMLGVFATPELLPPYIRWLAGMLIAGLLIALWPGIFRRVVNRALRIIKREPIEIFPSYAQMLRFVTASLMPGLLQGAALFLTLNALTPLSPAYFMTVTGTLFAAVLVGIAAIFAPSGIGVREGVLILVLSVFCPKATVIVAAVLMRLVMTAAELAMAGLFVAICRMDKSRM